MDNRITLLIIFLAIFVATCSLIKQNIAGVKTNSKKIIIKGDDDQINVFIINQDSIRIDSVIK